MADYEEYDDNGLDEQDDGDEELVEIDEEEQTEEQADRRVILNQFRKMRSQYMAKSVVWPYLSFE